MLLQPQQDGSRSDCVVVVVSLCQSRKIADFENRALGVGGEYQNALGLSVNLDSPFR